MTKITKLCVPKISIIFYRIQIFLRLVLKVSLQGIPLTFEFYFSLQAFQNLWPVFQCCDVMFRSHIIRTIFKMIGHCFFITELPLIYRSHTCTKKPPENMESFLYIFFRENYLHVIIIIFP